MDIPTLGVEEEFLLVDARSGRPRDAAVEVLARARSTGEVGLETELKSAMVETCSAVCAGLDDVRADLLRHRRVLVDAAAQLDAAILASGTHPVADAEDTAVSAGHRYRWLEQAYSATAVGTLVCGCHVHVAVPDREAGVAVLDRVRPWLAPLLAVSANSPLRRGVDTGYASWREQEWKRWPTSGPTGLFGSLTAYEDLVQVLIASGSALDEQMLYFDARLSARWPTVEIRVCDVCLDPEDAVLVAALARALVTTALRQREAPAPAVPVEVLRSAAWVASRHGTTGPLVDPVELRARPAAQVLARLRAHVGDALDDAGDTATVREGLARVLHRGTGAAVQRAALSAGGPAAVVDAITLR